MATFTVEALQKLAEQKYGDFTVEGVTVFKAYLRLAERDRDKVLDLMEQGQEDVPNESAAQTLKRQTKLYREILTKVADDQAAAKAWLDPMTADMLVTVFQQYAESVQMGEASGS